MCSLQFYNVSFFRSQPSVQMQLINIIHLWQTFEHKNHLFVGGGGKLNLHRLIFINVNIGTFYYLDDWSPMKNKRYVLMWRFCQTFLLILMFFQVQYLNATWVIPLATVWNLSILIANLLVYRLTTHERVFQTKWKVAFKFSLNI